MCQARIGGSVRGQIYPSRDADLWRVTLEERATYRIDLAGLTDGHAELFQRTATTPYSEASYERVAESSLVGSTARITHRVPDSVPGLTTHDIIVTGKGEHGDTYTLRVVRVNAPPTASDREVETAFDTVYTFTAADFGFEDPDEEDSLASVTVVTTPGKGTLALAGTAVTNNQSIPKADIDRGRLKFTPVTGEGGDDYTSFTFRVNDGAADSANHYTMTIDVPLSSLSLTETTDCPNSISTACTVEIGVPVKGALADGESGDAWAVQLEAGKTYRIVVKGAGDMSGGNDNPGTLPDPTLIIFDSTGTPTGALGNDDVAADNKNDRATFNVPSGQGGKYFVIVGAIGAVTDTRTYVILVTDLGVTPPMETTDCAADQTTACSIAVPGTVTGSLSSNSDIDAWGVELDEGKIYVIDARGVASGGGTLPDPQLQLNVVSSGVLIALTSDEDSGNSNDARITRRIFIGLGGTHYIRVLTSGTGGGTYTLSIREQQPLTETTDCAADQTTARVQHNGPRHGDGDRQ